MFIRSSTLVYKHYFGDSFSTNYLYFWKVINFRQGVTHVFNTTDGTVCTILSTSDALTCTCMWLCAISFAESTLPHAGNKFRCYEVKIEESEKPAVVRSRTQDTSGLSRQCSATEPQQPDNHQPSQSSMCTAQVALNAPVAHLAEALSMCRQNSIRGRPENSLHQERTHPE